MGEDGAVNLAVLADALLADLEAMAFAGTVGAETFLEVEVFMDVFDDEARLEEAAEGIDALLLDGAFSFSELSVDSDSCTLRLFSFLAFGALGSDSIIPSSKTPDSCCLMAIAAGVSPLPSFGRFACFRRLCRKLNMVLVTLLLARTSACSLRTSARSCQIAWDSCTKENFSLLR